MFQWPEERIERVPEYWPDFDVNSNFIGREREDRGVENYQYHHHGSHRSVQSNFTNG